VGSIPDVATPDYLHRTVPQINPFEVDAIFDTVLRCIVAGLILLPVLAGAVTALLLPAWKTGRGCVFNAGITVSPVPYLQGLNVDVLIILSGGLLAAVTGTIVQALASVIAHVTEKTR
jgi:hypothetical protein